jgi:TonB-linked SusC/RagA family outer membrane protein
MNLNAFNLGMPFFWLPPKLLLAMKITSLLLFIAVMQVSGSTYGQLINLAERNVPLSRVLKKIKSQSGKDILYANDLLNQANKINIKLYNVPLNEALDRLFENQPLDYEIKENTIVIKERKSALLDKISGLFLQDSLTFKGRVLDVFGQPLLGASVKVKGAKKATFTTKEGNFVIYADANAMLQVSYIGYETQELKLRREDAGLLRTFNMKPVTENLVEVAIVSTGYQNLPKERATGSFETITAKQLEHSNNPNLIKRLEGITTSMDFGNQLSGNSNLSSNIVKRSPLTSLTIRGKNTLVPPGSGLQIDLSNNSGQILVVIDGIPSPYSIDDINPDDVESINILKDAAAASIWGSRAANGVIVISTKKGKFNRPLSVSFNSNVNITDKINLFYKKFMSTSDFIDAQVQKYKIYRDRTGGPVADPTDPFNPGLYLSPVEEIVNDQELGRLSPTEAKAKLDALRGNDVRRDLDKYFLRKAVIQNYSLAIEGGTEKHAYRLSGGFSDSRNNTVPSSGNRYNLNYSVNLKPLKNLSLGGVVTYNQLGSSNQAGQNAVVGGGTNTGFSPYTRLADDQGNPAVVPRNYRPKYLQLLANKYRDKILDMSFKPLDDINQGYTKTLNKDLAINLNANYRISPVFSADLTYGYTYGEDETNTLNGVKSFYTREFINIWTTRETYIDPYSKLAMPLKKMVPLGGIYRTSLTNRNSQVLRGQLNAEKTWNEKHQLSAIAAVDLNQFYALTQFQDIPGYNESTLNTNSAIPLGIELERLFSEPIGGLSSGSIPLTPNSFIGVKTRSISFSSNAAYTYDRKYTLSASIRKDYNNVAGVAANRGNAPFISVGAMWNLNNEKFYHLDWLPVLQLKATYGYNGNINALVPATPVISYFDAPSFGGNLLPYASSQYVTNSELRSELARMLNLAISFGSKNSRLTGSVEYYFRKTTGLLTDGVLDPTTGYTSAIYNSANLRSKGFDVTLNSINLQVNQFRWTSNLTFSYNKVRVTKLYAPNKPTSIDFMNLNNVEGYDLNRMAAYRWAGLDPQTGDPRGYDANGNILTVSGDPNSPNAANLAKIQSVPISALHYFGSAVPVYYGAFRNTISYANFSLTAGIQYKLGYYFRRSLSDVIRYSTLFSDNILGAAEFANRWQKTGDEKFTNVPSLTFPASTERDEFYRLSEINVLRADHIRLQEINLAYTFKKAGFIRNPRIYANVSNLGIIWRANKAGIDPDINDYPQPRSYGLGLSANF